MANNASCENNVTFDKSNAESSHSNLIQINSLILSLMLQLNYICTCIPFHFFNFVFNLLKKNKIYILNQMYFITDGT